MKSSCSVIVAILGPPALGVKVRVIMHEPNAAIGLPAKQPLVGASATV